MELSELSLRVEKLEEIIQELAKWTNFNLNTKEEGTTDNSQNEKESHQNKNGRFGNMAKSAGEMEEDSSVVIKMELEENEDDADAISAQVHEDDDKELNNENGQASSATLFKFDPDEDPHFIPSDCEGAECSGAESDLMDLPKRPKKRRMSAKRKYEPLKVPHKSSLPPSEPFVSLQRLTPSQILPFLPKNENHRPNDLKRPSNSPKSKTKTASKTNFHKGDTRHFACPHCSYVAKNKTTFSSHIRSRHPSTSEEASATPIKCPECPKAFRFKETLSKHIANVHKKTDENFLCNSCPYVGRNRRQLFDHFRQNHKTPNFFCYFCPYKARRMSHLMEHMRTHTEEKPFNCPHCIYTAKKDSTMKRHVKKVHKKEARLSQFQIQYSKSPPFPTENTQTQGADVSSYKCEFCDFEGFTRLSLKGHLKEHRIKGDKIFKCPHCPYATAFKRDLSNHILSMHPKDGEESHRPFKCAESAECQKTFRFKGGLSSHILSMHRNKDKSFLCDSCPYLATNLNALRQHIKNHHDQKKDAFLTCYFCPWRGKEFDKVVNHMRIHTGETPYKCPHCIYTSTRRITLKRHLKNAHGNEEGSFQCEKCSCKLKSHSWLMRHQQMHNKPGHGCGICGFEAYNRDSLREHLKCHKTEDGKMFQCPHCLKTFKSRFVMQGHVRTHNPYKCEKCACSFQEQSQLISHKNTCRSILGHNDLKDKGGLLEQGSEPIAAVLSHCPC